jgi:hypothetical protein
LSFAAGMILMEVYSTCERRGVDVRRVGERLLKEYPNNFDVGLQLAENYASPAIEYPDRAAGQHEAVLKRELAWPAAQGSEKHRARLGLAAIRQQQWRFKDSIRAPSEGVAENPLAPGWVMPTLLLRRGNNRALIVDPAAREDAHRVRADVRWRDFHKSADEQLAWIERRQRSGEDQSTPH